MHDSKEQHPAIAGDKEEQTAAEPAALSQEKTATASGFFDAHRYPSVLDRLCVDLRRIWENLLLGSHEGIKTVLFCGATRGEGATFTAFHMALYLAIVNDMRVLYVDTNLDRPRNDVLPPEIIPARGLLSYAFEAATLESLIQRTHHPQLYVLPAGTGDGDKDPKPALLNKRTLEPLLRHCKAHFDVAIINGQPVTIHPSVIEFARLVDRVALVCRYGYSRREVSKQAISSLMEGGVSQVGVILTDRQYPIPTGLYRALK
jgi:Mrp family chromosome partitioning ATPase